RRSSTSLLFFTRQGQSEDRHLSRPSHVDAVHVIRIRQIKSLAELAAINFGVRSPRLLDVAALLLQHVGHVIPAFQMAAAELAFRILLVAGALSGFLDFDLVIGKLLRYEILRGYRARSRQEPTSSGGQ